MSRKPKPPRLHLRSRDGRGRYWVILDRGHEFGTSCGEGDRAGAERALARYIAAKYEPPKGARDLDQLLIADVVNVYLKERAPKTNSLEFLVHTAAPVIEWWGEHHPALSDIKEKTCHDYVEWRVSRGVSDQTARHDLKTLRAAIRYYHRAHGPLPAVPAVTLPAKKEQRHDYWLTRTQVAERIKAARRRPETRHVARVLLIGAYTGTRPGAIFKLRWIPSADGGWFDLDSETLHRRGIGRGETKKRQPPARIHRRLLPHLKRWRKADMAEGITYVTHYFGEPIKKLRRSWASVAIAAGHARRGDDGKWIVEDGPHITRHTAATWLMQAGVDQFEAAGYLGMNPETLWETYGHHSPLFQEKASRSDSRRR